MKKYSILIAMVLVLALSVTTFAGSFADVPSNHWAYEGVNKLVAAGLIQGYPDGTFKGQNDLTRYEIAVMLARLLNDIEEARAELVDQVDFMVNDALIEANSGLSAQEAEDVQAILEAVLAKNDNDSDAPAEVPVPQELSSGQAGEVMTMIGNLASEFAPELETLGVEVAELQDRVDDLEVVTWSGEYKAEFKHFDVEGTAYANPFNAGDAYGTDEDPDGDGDDEDYFKHSLDLDAAINYGPLSADLNLKASVEGLGIDEYDSGDEFDLDSLSAVITGPEFKATIKEGQDETIREYLFKKWVDD
ncbi:MAG: S-layer homology domain-containing protein, partial [Halanaerobiales bacterium]